MMGANVKVMMTGDSKVVVAKLAMAGMQSAPAFEKGSVVESVSGNELPAMEPMGADMEPDPAVDAVARAKTHPAMRAGANSQKNAAGGFGYSERRFMSNWRFSNSPCTASKNSTPLR